MFSFGATSATPPTSTPGGGFQFGAPAPAATTPATGLTFGTPGAAPAFGAPASQPQSQTTPAPATSFQFGAPSAAATSTPAPATGLTFGTGGTLPVPSFGSPAAAATTTQAAAPAATGGFQFGAPAPAASTAAPVAGFGLGTGGTLPTFGVPAATTTTQVTTGQPVLSLGVPSSTAPATAAVAPTLTLGTAPATTLAPSLGTGTLPSFGIPTTTQAQATTTTTADASATGQPQQPAPFTTLAGGLGGTPSTAFADNTFSAAITGAGGPVNPNATPAKPGNVRDPTLPPELALLVDELKNTIRKDRETLLKIETTKNPVQQVALHCEEIRQSVANVCSVNTRVILNLQSLQKSIDTDIRDAETALLMREVPLSHQHNYQFPMEYFFRKVKDYEDRLTQFEREIEKAEARLCSERQEPASPMDLYRALKVSRDCAVVLASKIKDLHERCLKQVQIHKNIRHYVHGEMAPDIFRDKLVIPSRTSAPPRQNLQFPNLIPPTSEDPTKLYLSYLASSKVMPSGAPFHSTLSYPSYHTQQSKPYESMPFSPSGSGSPMPFYHSQMGSPGQHHASLNLTGPGQISPGLSLKRTKH